MKKGFWNYTEPVEYRVIIVKLLPVANPPMHWQNTFAGQERQAVEITHHHDGTSNIFIIDNYDGQGLSKVRGGGSPGHGSRHI